MAGLGGYYRPQDLITLCDHCGVHYAGPFQSRFDVPLAKIHAHVGEVRGTPGRGHYEEAPRAPVGSRTGRKHKIYKPGPTEPGEPNEPVTNGLCTRCAMRSNRERGVRVSKLAARAKPAKDPTEAEALAFLMGKSDDDDDDDDGGEGEGEGGNES